MTSPPRRRDPGAVDVPLRIQGRALAGGSGSGLRRSRRRPPDADIAQRRDRAPTYETAIRTYVRFCRRAPRELFHFMVDADRHATSAVAGWWRRTWRRSSRGYTPWAKPGAHGGGTAEARAARVLHARRRSLPDLWVAPECTALTGTDPRTPASITRHADLIADLFAAGLISPVT